MISQCTQTLTKSIVKSAFRAEAGWYTKKELERVRGLAPVDSDLECDYDDSSALDLHSSDLGSRADESS